MAAPPPSASHPGRTLTIFMLVVVALGGLMFALDSTPTPNLGLDLEGGTSITLTATPTDGGEVTSEALQTAVEIIRSRVDGAGVAESEVTTQGSTTIVVAVPGVSPDALVELVGTTAELRFRQVLVAGPGFAIPTPPPVTGSPDPSASPGATTGATTSPATTDPPTTDPGTTLEPSSAPAALGGRRGSSVQSGIAGLAGLANGTTTSPATTSPAATTPATTAPTGSDSPSPTTSATTPSPADDPTGEAAAAAAYAELDCTDPANLQGGNSDDPAKALATCDAAGGTKYLLAPATVLGTDVTDAFAGLPQTGVGDWQVNLEFNGDGADSFGAMTQELVVAPPPTNQFAIVLDGLVQSAPRVINAILDGRAQITGDFTQSEASELANVLKYGALPLRFETSDVTDVTATLGRDSLRAGLIAGLIGLALVLVYAMVYYRALGSVIVGSLGIAALITYIAVVLLSEWIGFTLTLAGIAGLIVAIGITADSFIIYFERIRDEIREGRTLRAAIEHGWLRARRTIIAADVVSLLSSVVLYIVSIGNVRGFAFALGLSTAVDLVVVFLFTKPLMTWFGKRQFFGEGSRWSGLSGDRLGGRNRPGGTPGPSSTRAARLARTAEEA